MSTTDHDPHDPHDPEDASPPDQPATQPGATRRRIQFLAVLVVLVLALLVAVLLIVATTIDSDPDRTDTSEAPMAQSPTIWPQPVTDVEALVQATTFTTLSAAPLDAEWDRAPSGRVVHPRHRVPVYARPGGPAIAALPPQQITSSTWVPVIAEEPGWVQVLLPSRPNGATGWLWTEGGALDVAATDYRVVVDRAAFRLHLYRAGKHVAAWTVGIGKPGAETPPGRTFLLASLRDSRQRFSPVILPLGAHSTSHETYGGGPGTTGIHTWPTSEVFGRASSDGCIRVPADALHLLSTRLPIGTPVLIT